MGIVCLVTSHPHFSLLSLSSFSHPLAGFWVKIELVFNFLLEFLDINLGQRIEIFIRDFVKFELKNLQKRLDHLLSVRKPSIFSFFIFLEINNIFRNNCFDSFFLFFLQFVQESQSELVPDLLHLSDIPLNPLSMWLSKIP